MRSEGHSFGKKHCPVSQIIARMDIDKKQLKSVFFCDLGAGLMLLAMGVSGTRFAVDGSSANLKKLQRRFAICAVLYMLFVTGYYIHISKIATKGLKHAIDNADASDLSWLKHKVPALKKL